MTEHTSQESIIVGSFEELLAQLHRLAIEYRESFSGVVLVGCFDPAVLVMVKEDGLDRVFRITSPNPQGMETSFANLRMRGFLDEATIHHENIIADFQAEARQREEDLRQEEQKQNEKKEARRFQWKQMAVSAAFSLCVSVLVAIVTFVTLPNSLNEKVRELERSIKTLERANANPGAVGIGPVTRPGKP